MPKTNIDPNGEFYWDWLKHEENIFTNRSNFFLVAEAMFLAAYAALSTTKNKAEFMVVFSLCMAGFFITLVWLFVNAKHIINTGKQIREKLEDADERVKKIRDVKGIWRLRSLKLIGYIIPSILLVLWTMWGAVLL